MRGEERHGAVTDWPSLVTSLIAIPRLTAPLLALGRILMVLAVVASPAAAQQTELERSRRRIQEIRAEREELQRQQARLQGQLRDVTTELRNLERQRDVTNRLVNEIERQINGLGTQLDQTSAER